MKNIKIKLIFVFVFCYTLVLSQQFKDCNFFVKDSDKVTISTVYFRDKTTEPPPILKRDSATKLYYPEDEVKEVIKKTGTVSLNNNEKEKIISLLKKPNLGHALPYQYDIQLDFYKKNEIVQTVTISSITRNLVIKKVGCKTYIDKDGQEIDPCFFRGSVSNNLKKYVVSLLKNKKLWNKEQQFIEDHN